VAAAGRRGVGGGRMAAEKAGGMDAAYQRMVK